MPDYKPTSEQNLMRESIRAYLSAHAFAQDAEGMRADWAALSNTLGLAGAVLPADAGGLGGDMSDAILIMEELGRALAPTPFIDTSLIAPTLLAAARTEDAGKLLADIAAGATIVSLAHEEPNTRFGRVAPGATAQRLAKGYSLSGRKVRVNAALSAHNWIVSASVDGKVALFVIEADAAFVSRQYEMLDGRPASDIEFSDAFVPDSALLRSDAVPHLSNAYNRGIVGICAEGVGCMRAMLAQTVEHTRTRRQFGRALAELQVVRHGIADMLIAVEKAAAITHRAALTLDEGEDSLDFVAAAKFTTSRALRFVGQSAVQFHGAIGMTDELPLSRYFKRATVIAAQFGGANDHLANFVESTSR